MRRISLYLLIGILVLMVGLSCVWFWNIDQRDEETLADEPIAVASSPQRERLRFLPTARGCSRNGYVQGYELPDGQTMSEGGVGYPSKRRTRSELKKWLSKASQRVEQVDQYENRFKEKGKRVVALFPADASGKELAIITWYGGGNSFSFIQAPSLDLALEFEKSSAYAY